MRQSSPQNISRLQGIRYSGMLSFRAGGLHSIALLLVLSSFTIIPPSLGTTSYFPGIKVGDWWTYGSINVHCNFLCPPEVKLLQEVSSIDSSVTEITGSDVEIEGLVTFTNGTEKAWTLTGNVETGQGNLTYSPVYFLIAGDLVKGDPIYNSPSAPTINDTLVTTAATLPQSENLLALSNPLYTLWQYWDQEKGVLAQAYFSAIGLQGSILLTNSIWHHASDFTVFLNATSVSLKPGEDRNLMVRVASRNGFEGSVGLSVPSQPAGLSLGMDPPTVAIQPSGSANSILTITALQQAPPGVHLVRVTASNQTVSHSTFLTIKLGDFTIAANLQHLPMATNANASVTISLTSVDNFAGEVQLTAVEITQNPSYGPIVNDPSGPRPFLNPSKVILAENGHATAALRVQTPNLPIRGTFTIKITATSGALSHSLDITVTVAPLPDTSSGPTSQNNAILGLSPFLFYSLTGGTLAVLATAGALFVLTRRKSGPPFSAET